jgi:hypothetical protein
MQLHSDPELRQQVDLANTYKGAMTVTDNANLPELLDAMIIGTRTG